MSSSLARTAAAALLVGASLTAGAVAVPAAAPATATAGLAPVSASTTLERPPSLQHFDLASGRQPENVVLDRDGSVTVAFATSREVARIDADGRVSVLATLPLPSGSTATTPVLGVPFLTGLVRDGDTYYVGYVTGTAAETGIWALQPGQEPHRVAALPADGLPNGMALDEERGVLYVADSLAGLIYTVSPETGQVGTFSSDAALRPGGFLGVNGLKLRDGAVWVTNSDTGALLRIPVTREGRAAPPQVVASGVVGIDDFEFTGRGSQVIAAVNTGSQVVLIDRGRTTTVLTASDGLSNPTAVAVRGRTVYVVSAAFSTQEDPNLLVTHLTRR